MLDSAPWPLPHSVLEEGVGKEDFLLQTRHPWSTAPCCVSGCLHLPFSKGGSPNRWRFKALLVVRGVGGTGDHRDSERKTLKHLILLLLVDPASRQDFPHCPKELTGWCPVQRKISLSNKARQSTRLYTLSHASARGQFVFSVKVTASHFTLPKFCASKATANSNRYLGGSGEEVDSPTLSVLDNISTSTWGGRDRKYTVFPYYSQKEEVLGSVNIS